MSRITSSAALRGISSGFALVTLLSLAPQPAFAEYGGFWALNMAQSKFGPGVNTLVLEHNSGQAPAAAPGSRAAGTVVVISHGNIYLSAPGATPAANGTPHGMDLEQIGANVHVVGDCGYFCRQTRPNSRLVLSFTGVNGGPHDMGEVVVFNQR